ncbi:MAG: AMP phosphorylase, partial [Nanoarchaeota archaeon]|nr:AMP phosphorylase [Nanoarchaeota archaeon]
IKILFNGTAETVVIDSGAEIPQGMIGLFEEAARLISLQEGQEVEIKLARKPLSLDVIKKKLDGGHLNKKELKQLVWDIVHNKLSDVEITFFVAASYAHHNSLDETVWLTEAMAEQGERLNLRRKPILDKHCIGGIPGNRTTPIVVPILAAAGYTMPKTSSRAITSPAGTADTMEVLTTVVLSLDKMKQVVEETNACMVWGGALNLAPADDRIITVEKTLMIDAESQLLASILAKKYSVRATHVLIDIPIGPHTKITHREHALELGRKFKHIGKRLGMNVRVVLTDGRQPIGNGIGPALEAREVLQVLRQDAGRPKDLEKKSLMLAAQLFTLAGAKDGQRRAEEILRSGKAYAKMRQIIALQGGNPDITPEQILLAKNRYVVKALRPGKVKAIDNLMIAKLARIAGAPKNKGAGLYLHKHLGDSVKQGDALFTVYCDSQDKLEYVEQIAKEMQPIKW